MPEPTSAAIISAGVAVVGTAYAIGKNAMGESGFNVGECTVQYPKEFPSEQLMHVHQSVQWDIIKFKHDILSVFGGVESEFTVSATGYLGNDDDELYGYPDSDHPGVPINRFIGLSLTQGGSSDNMSQSLLNCSIQPWGGPEMPAEGTPEDPWVALHVYGRWDPVGIGDMQFEFKMGINTYGQVYTDEIQFNGVTSPLDDFSIEAHPDVSFGEMMDRLRECNFTCEPEDTCVVVDFR
jgi:hypothetical protein